MVEYNCKQISPGVKYMFLNRKMGKTGRALSGSCVLCAAFLSLAAVLVAEVFAGNDFAEWWNEDWQNRIVVKVQQPPPGETMETVIIGLGDDSPLCLPGGEDIRILSQDGAVLDHKVSLEEDERVSVLFRASADSPYHYIYFGNPDADEPPAPSLELEEQGGLILRTYPLPERIFSAEAIRNLIGSAAESYGESRTLQINDSSNPFGPDRNYLAVYTGMLYAPEDGEYVFAVKARDAALFQLLDGGNIVLECNQDSTVLPGGWEIPGQPDAKKSVQLRAGWYEVRYYHAANTAPHLAKLGWRTPSGKAVTVAPPAAFPGHLPARLIARETLDGDLNPFFDAEHLYDLRIGPDGAVFSHYHFSASDYICAREDDLSYEWIFGDGSRKEGKDVRHEFPRRESRFDVTLRVRRQNGDVSQLTRRLQPQDGAVAEIHVDMEVDLISGFPVLRQDQELDFVLSFHNRGELYREFSYRVGAEDSNGSRELASGIIDGLQPAPDGGGWVAVTQQLPKPSEDTRMHFSLLLHGHVVQEKAVTLIQAAGDVSGLHLDASGNLMDEEGNPALLALSGLTLRDAGYRRYGRSGGVIKIVVIDSLNLHSSGALEASYLQILESSLGSMYRPLEFEITVLDPYPSSPLQGFFAVKEAVRNHNPDILMLSGFLGDRAAAPQPDDFELSLSAAIEQVLSRTDTALVMVTPPPVPGRLHSTRNFSRIIKRVGFLKRIPVADPYSRFMLQPDRNVFFGDAPAGDWHPDQRFLLNQKAQQLIAEEIVAAIVRHINVELHDTIRRTSL